MTAQESTQNALSIYEDTPLEFRQDDSIRLLSVLPEKSPEGYVQCILFHSTIKEMEETYTCLSYVWKIESDIANQVDSTTETTTNVFVDSSAKNIAQAPATDQDGEKPKRNSVLVNWKPIKVLQNLYEFLQVACQKYPGEPLWIDALCINQNSITERNHQVSRMGKIYSHARRVLSWVGPCDSDVNSVDILRNFILQTENPDEVQMMARALPNSRAKQAGRKDDEVQEALASQTSQNNHRQGAMTYDHKRFFQAVETYYSRAWITQELAVARRVVLLFGKAELDLNELPEEDLLRVTQEKFELGCYPGPWPNTPVYRVWALANDKRWEDRRHWVRVHNHLCLLDLIAQHRDKRCLRGRDRIYSLKYLSVEGHDLPINYETPSIDLLFHIIQISQRSLCFCAALALVGALAHDEDSGDWNSVYLAVKIPSNPSNVDPRKPLRTICSGTYASLVLDSTDGTLEYVGLGNHQIGFPSSQLHTRHAWFESGGTEGSYTAYLSVAYLRHIVEEDKASEDMSVLENAMARQHIWIQDSVTFVRLQSTDMVLEMRP